jgi:predicted regulator of Ras-like GTPase activity (Roadblock/LC7/MglB family)
MPAEYREDRLVQVLREQLYEKVEGVKEAVIVTNDGLVVAAFPGADEAQDVHSDVSGSHWIAAMAAEIIAQSRRAFGQLAQGAVSRILVEGESGSMIVIPAGDQANLAALVDTHTKLGLAMFQITRAAAHVGDLLD